MVPRWIAITIAAFRAITQRFVPGDGKSPMMGHSTAGAPSLLRTQFIDRGRNRKIFEVGQVPTSRASLHPPQLVLGFPFPSYIFGVDRLALQLLAELQQ
jgi:hypothetical protein